MCFHTMLYPQCLASRSLLQLYSDNNYYSLYSESLFFLNKTLNALLYRKYHDRQEGRRIHTTSQ